MHEMVWITFVHPCIHLTFVSYDYKFSKSLDLVSIWSFDEFSSLCLRILTIKPISHLTLVCYHQNPIRRTLGLTETNLGDGFYTFLIDEDPRSYKEAITSLDAPFWKEAINSEIESIMYTWELVDLPLGPKTIGCRWIFKRKLKQDGSIRKYKARLVAKGFKQRNDVYYFDTFAPVTIIASIRVLITLTSIHN